MGDRHSIIVNSEGELDKAVSLYLSKKQFPILLLKGDLGAGKTAFIKKMIQNLGTQDTVSSPSFSIINQYETVEGRPVFHIDLYRLESAEEAFNTGLEEYLYSGELCFVEWPQIILDYIEEPYHLMEIEILDDGSRRFTFE